MYPIRLVFWRGKRIIHRLELMPVIDNKYFAYGFWHKQEELFTARKEYAIAGRLAAWLPLPADRIFG